MYADGLGCAVRLTPVSGESWQREIYGSHYTPREAAERFISWLLSSTCPREAAFNVYDFAYSKGVRMYTSSIHTSLDIALSNESTQCYNRAIKNIAMLIISACETCVSLTTHEENIYIIGAGTRRGVATCNYLKFYSLSLERCPWPGFSRRTILTLSRSPRSFSLWPSFRRALLWSIK